MKKKAGKFIVIILIVIMIIVGKKIIDNKTFDYTDIVNDSLSSYYISGIVDDLKPIIDLFEKYKSDDNIVQNIQTYSDDIIGRWYTYLDDKYLCDRSNVNSCRVQLEEFKILATRLNNLYTYRSSKGYTIILPSVYNNLKHEGDKKIADLEKVVASPSAKSPYNSEEIRAQKCNAAVDCENCREGLCKCYYVTENKTRESITCKKDTTQ